MGRYWHEVDMKAIRLSVATGVKQTSARPAKIDADDLWRTLILRGIIEAESVSFFDPSAKAQDIAIRAVRDAETPIGIRSGVCLRATLTNRAGHEMAPQIYLMTFDKVRIFQRQIAEPRHGCAGQHFDTPLAFRPAEVVQASKKTRKPRASRRSAPHRERY
ncbi:MAG: hypothetical protein QOF64_2840 [Candidatus Binatota bacterium]|jgi:hypothetical protein|nr:hypothetical protein [Candidatus Binatota bacterium]